MFIVHDWWCFAGSLLVLLVSVGTLFNAKKTVHASFPLEQYSKAACAMAMHYFWLYGVSFLAVAGGTMMYALGHDGVSAYRVTLTQMLLVTSYNRFVGSPVKAVDYAGPAPGAVAGLGIMAAVFWAAAYVRGESATALVEEVVVLAVMEAMVLSATTPYTAEMWEGPDFQELEDSGK